MTSFAIEGARVFLPDDIVETTVQIDQGIISAIGAQADGPVVNGKGLVLAPALIDVHGDAFERQIMPRPGVFFPLDVALLDTDRQLAANGIATAYHALTFSWAPGLRAVDRSQAVIDALARLRPRLSVENRLQLRWETFAFEAVEVIEAALAAELTPSLAFNDHTSMSVRSFDVSLQTRAFEQDPEFATASFDDIRLKDRVAGDARRADVSVDAYLRLLRDVWDRRPEVDTTIRRLAETARRHGAPMLSHDDTQVATRAYYNDLGATVAEFPMTLEPAHYARAHGGAIIFGAPNVVRGGSHIGSLSASDMIEEGLCDALASDYFYPAMLTAIARLDAERRATRSALWSLVSAGPARAMNLTDRGQIAVGQRADLVLIDWPDDAPPVVRATYSAGRTAFASTPGGA